MVPEDSPIEQEIVDAVQAIRRGNAQAYAAIVKRFQGSMMTLCVAILRDHQAADEVVQDVFVRAYQRLDTFDLERPMKPWLVKIAYRLAQQRWRASSNELMHRKAAMARLQQSHSDQDPSRRLLRQERSEVLWNAVHELPLAQRAAVLLYYRDNLTIHEVARVMTISSGTVKTHLFRARNQLQLGLRKQGLDQGDLS